MTNKLDIQRNSDGKLPAYARAGGYPIYYLDRENSVMCADCATKSADDPDEIEKFKPESYGIHYEGPVINCDQCGAEIESAYGDPNTEEDATS
jgi:hypothetical protein